MKNEMTQIIDSANILTAASKADADAIQAIVEAAAKEIEAILLKYANVPTDISLPLLTHGRNAVASMKMHYPRPMPTVMTDPATVMPHVG